MITRHATALDVDALVQCVVDFASVSYPNDKPDRRHITGVVLGAMDNDHSLVAVIEDDAGKVAGCYLGTKIENMISGAATAVEILFYVSPGYRGHGAKLLTFAEQWAEDQGCKSMFLSCPASAPRAAKYFEAKGYKLTECHYGKAL